MGKALHTEIPPTRSARKGALPLAGVLLFVVTLWVYRPGLSGTFLFDDYYNLVDNQAVQIDTLSWSNLAEAAGSGHAGPLGRPVSMLSFALNHVLSGPAPHGYLVGNLVIHLLCGGAVYWLTLLLLAGYRRRGGLRPASGTAPWLALLVSAAWLLHPINLTSVLYVVQRMASLAALFTFLSLALYLRGRLNQMAGRPGWPALLTMALVTAPLALFSKENAVLLPVFVGLTEWMILDFRAASPALARGLRRGWVVALAGMCVGGLAFGCSRATCCSAVTPRGSSPSRSACSPRPGLSGSMSA